MHPAVSVEPALQAMTLTVYQVQIVYLVLAGSVHAVAFPIPALML